MPVLHLVNRSPFESRTLEHCLQRTGEGDTVLLIGDGVYGVFRLAALMPPESAAASRIRICALRPDLEQRGIQPGRVDGRIQIVDFPGFVDLAVSHPLIQSWY